jgi:hypothetical protein
MTHDNPYAPPGGAIAPVANRSWSPYGFWQICCLVLLGGLIAIVIWIFLILSLFALSSAVWPGFACAVPALVGAFYVCRARTVQRILVGPQSPVILSVTATSILLAPVITASMSAYGASHSVWSTPLSSTGMAPVHWFRIAAAGIGAVTGGLAVAGERERLGRLIRAVAFVSSGISVSYLLMCYVAFLSGW